jgi:hypothetical protein
MLQSLYATGLQAPEDVVQHCLTLFRKADALAQLAEFLPSDAISFPPQPINVGGTLYTEHGPLSSLASIADVAARRALPGHLLRRSRILSVLRLPPDVCELRVKIAACTGEEATFVWTLGYTENEKWVVQSIRLDLEDGTKPLPSTPHPRHTPEAIVAAQLASLNRGDVYDAASFNFWQAPLRNSDEPSRVFGLQYRLFAEALKTWPMAALLRHEEAVLGVAALPSQRSMVQEVVLKRASIEGDSKVLSVTGDWVRLVWRLGLHGNGCWMVLGITPASDTSVL